MVLNGLPKLGDMNIVKRFMVAVRAKLPTLSKRYLSDLSEDFWDPRPVIKALLDRPASTLADLRLRALFAIRSVALLRSKDATTIVRATIHELTVPASPPRRILAFRYRGKAAIKANLPFETNYIEFLPDPARCPAMDLLRYKDAIDKREASHPFLFSSLSNDKPLVAQTLANLVVGFLEVAGIDKKFRAHSVRAMVSELFNLLAVPKEQVNRRGAWASEDGCVRDTNYMSRFVPTNFASLLYDPETNASSTP